MEIFRTEYVSSCLYNNNVVEKHGTPYYESTRDSTTPSKVLSDGLGDKKSDIRSTAPIRPATSHSTLNLENEEKEKKNFQRRIMILKEEICRKSARDNGTSEVREPRLMDGDRCASVIRVLYCRK
jgi:hypothetical protein